MTQNKFNLQNEELIYGYPKAVHDLAEVYVNSEILKCESSLVTDLLAIEHHASTANIAANFSYDNVENYYQDFDRILDGTVRQSRKDEIKQLCTQNNLNDGYDIEDFITNSENESKEIAHENIEDLTVLARILNYQDPQEIFEWWAVTEWLGNKLMESGEPVLSNDYGYWWGRTCTGQAIILDGTIQKIAVQSSE